MWRMRSTATRSRQRYLEPARGAPATSRPREAGTADPITRPGYAPTSAAMRSATSSGPMRAVSSSSDAARRSSGSTVAT